MIRLLRFVWFGLLAVSCAVVGCAPDYSPNVYSPDAVQQANKVERGVVVGFRQVEIQSDGTVGAVAGGAAGGVLGAQTGGESIDRSLGAVGGALVGGLVGTAVAHTTGDTTGWEYIVRETGGNLVSVTQRQPKPLPVGQSVLVIMGKQARIVPDYAASLAPKPGTPAKPPSPPPPQSKAPAAAAPTAITPPAPPAQAATSSAAPSAPPPIPAAALLSPTPSSAPAASSSDTSTAAAPKPASP